MRNSLKKPRVCALFGQDYKDCSGLAFTFVKHRSKAAGGFNSPNQARNFKVSREPRDYAASFSIELTSKP